MRTRHLNAPVLAMMALGWMTVGAANAPQGHLGEEVDHTYHDSKDFRHYFEHNFSAYGHEPTWTYMESSGHVEHVGRRGQMTLKDAIQNMDEDVERLHAEFKHHDASPAAHDLALEIQDHSRQVESRMGQTGDWYHNHSDRDWKWDQSELNTKWRNLRADIDRMTDDLGGPGR